MPSAPAFDYYEALGVEKTATTQEIISAYRRLALVHHPDRNPDKTAEATAAFQKINIAHETLTNERSRAIYDARSEPRSSGRPGRSPFDSDDDSYYGGDESIDPFADTQFFRGGGRVGGPTFVFNSGGFTFSFTPPDREEINRMRREQEAAEEAWRKRFVDEAQRRKDLEEAKAKIRIAAKEAEEKLKAMAKEMREKDERIKQEKIWANENATTQAHKQETCLHSEFWAKEKYPRKIKCTSCGQRRGMVGHRCPHCSLLVCQVCLNDLKKKKFLDAP